MEPLLDFFGVALVVEFEKALENFSAGWFADGEANALLGFVEAMAKVEVGPAVGGGNSLIHFNVEITKLLDVGVGLVGVVEAVVGVVQRLTFNNS